jgi:hypothetical protein
LGCISHLHQQLVFNLKWFILNILISSRHMPLRVLGWWTYLWWKSWWLSKVESDNLINILKCIDIMVIVSTVTLNVTINKSM